MKVLLKVETADLYAAAKLLHCGIWMLWNGEARATLTRLSQVQSNGKVYAQQRLMSLMVVEIFWKLRKIAGMGKVCGAPNDAPHYEGRNRQECFGEVNVR